MINIAEVKETNDMIEKENLDVRTITLGISLLNCIDDDLDRLNEKIYNRITTVAKDLVPTGKAIELEYGIPIVNKTNISYTCRPCRRLRPARSSEDFVTIAKTLDRAAKGGWCQLYRWIFCTCVKGDDKERTSFLSELHTRRQCLRLRTWCAAQ